MKHLTWLRTIHSVDYALKWSMPQKKISPAVNRHGTRFVKNCLFMHVHICMLPVCSRNISANWYFVVCEAIGWVGLWNLAFCWVGSGHLNRVGSRPTSMSEHQHTACQQICYTASNAKALNSAVNLSQTDEKIGAYALHSLHGQISTQVLCICSADWQAKAVPKDNQTINNHDILQF